MTHQALVVLALFFVRLAGLILFVVGSHLSMRELVEQGFGSWYWDAFLYYLAPGFGLWLGGVLMMSLSRTLVRLFVPDFPSDGDPGSVSEVPFSTKQIYALTLILLNVGAVGTCIGLIVHELGHVVMGWLIHEFYYERDVDLIIVRISLALGLGGASVLIDRRIRSLLSRSDV